MDWIGFKVSGAGFLWNSTAANFDERRWVRWVHPVMRIPHTDLRRCFLFICLPRKNGKSRKIEPDSKTVANCSSIFLAKNKQQTGKQPIGAPWLHISHGFGPFWKSKSWVQSAASPIRSAIRKRLPESLQRKLPGEVVQITDENLI